MKDELFNEGNLKMAVAKPVSSAIFDTPIPTDFIPVEMDVYSPTRLDYFASRALQGLVTGRSEKDRRVAAKQAVVLAKQLVELLDKASD